MKKDFQESLINRLFPFAPHFIDAKGGQMHYIDEGRGEVIMLLHGNPTWSFLYRKFITPLSKNFRVIAPDHIGFGKSDKPSRWQDYSLKMHVDNLEALIEYLGLKNITLVMQDWGGPIGLGYAARHPENVSRLVVMNTAGKNPKPENLILPFPIRLFRAPGLGNLLVQGMNFFVEKFMPMATIQKEKLTKEVMDGYRYPFPTWASRAGVLAFPRLIPARTTDEGYLLLKEVEEKFWPKFKGKALIVWPLKDIAFKPVLLEEWKQLLPQAEVHTLENAGHYLQEEEPEKIIQWMTEFLVRK